tara:strand:+ start:166 stop:708 length:543 start_codon:yes stop_codon:yes gene_type:complete
MKINVNIPAGVSGDFEIAHYTKDTTDNRWPLYLLHTNEAYDNYTVLLKKGHSMPLMQDSEAEYNDHQWLWDNAEGDVIIGGLGVGLVNHVLIDNPNITSVTIIEKYQDVIDLVWDNCPKDERFTLIHADIETWEIPTDSQWDIGFFDTWISNDDWDLDEYKNNMIEKYGPYITKINGWCW